MRLEILLDYNEIRLVAKKNFFKRHIKIHICSIVNKTTLICVLASIAVDHGFEPRSDQTKNYKIVICCFSAKHVALRSKIKDGLTQNN